MVSVQFPLCLEDVCMINILFKLDEYPIEILALLPRAIRQRLYRGLSPADHLHYYSTSLFDDVDRKYDDDWEWYLVEIILTSRIQFRMTDFMAGKVLSCLIVDSELYQRRKECIEHITKCYSGALLVIDNCHYPVLVPNRFLQYISVDDLSLKSTTSLELSCGKSLRRSSKKEKRIYVSLSKKLKLIQFCH